MSEHQESSEINYSAELVKKAEKFVAEEFEKHPHYSFNDHTVMRDHSYKVRDLALEISEETNADKLVVAIGALLHDIGKTYEADPETLHTKHEDYNLIVSESFLRSLNLSDEQYQKLEQILQHESSSEEMKIIEDADALALYADKRLYTLYIDWARKENLNNAIERKLAKFDKLHYEKSRQIGRPWFEQMKKDWSVV